jgi:CTP synthase
VAEALKHAGIANKVRVVIDWIHSEEVTDQNAKARLGTAHGILVPGGFGDRGIEGKIAAIRYAREHKIPFFGICLGMQLAVIEYARNILGLADANSSELNPFTKHPVIDLMPDQLGIIDKGGTMRLGLYPCKVAAGSKAFEAYGQELIQERHRHRYEVNNAYRKQLSSKGMIFSGMSPDGHLVEIIELPDHPWFVAGQFHPEFISRPTRPQPLFKAFIKAAKIQSEI